MVSLPECIWSPIPYWNLTPPAEAQLCCVLLTGFVIKLLSFVFLFLSRWVVALLHILKLRCFYISIRFLCIFCRLVFAIILIIIRHKVFSIRLVLHYFC